MLTAASFMIAGIQKQHKCLLTDEWKKKKKHIHTHNRIVFNL